MQNLNELRDRLNETLSKKATQESSQQQALETRMTELAKRQGEFASLARRLFSEIVEPRMKLLEEYFDDVRYQPGARECFGTVILNREGRFSAAVTLEMGIDCDQQADNVIVKYHLRIIPILMDFQKEDELSLPLGEVTEEKVCSFVDEKVAQCAETYIRLQENPHHQKHNQVTDPVCGMTIHQLSAVASLEHEGKTYYFCAMMCKERFAENPSQFVKT